MVTSIGLSGYDQGHVGRSVGGEALASKLPAQCLATSACRYLTLDQDESSVCTILIWLPNGVPPGA